MRSASSVGTCEASKEIWLIFVKRFVPFLSIKFLTDGSRKSIMCKTKW